MALDAALPAAPGAPGIGPTWCRADKEIVGGSLGPARLWFTIGGGILNEVYYPRVDLPQIRDLGFIVADGAGFWIELKRLGKHTVELAAPGVPAVRVVHRHERFTLTLRIVPDPRRDVLLIEFALEGDAQLKPYVLLAPHLGGSGDNNLAAATVHRQRRVLWAEQGPFGLAFVVDDARHQDGLGRMSAGHVGTSDGWQDFDHNGAMLWQYGSAGPGNVALTGELPRSGVAALGFASSKEAATTLAGSAIQQSFDECWARQVSDWQAWHAQCAAAAPALALAPDLAALYLNSAMVLRVHQDKVYPGAMVASMSIPWGNMRDERGGYHLVWPRDLVQCAGAMLELGAISEARDVLQYLIATQNADGHWFQNQWLGGDPFWQGVQLDEASFPVLLAVALAERDALDGIDVTNMVRRALGFIVCNGPVSPQDRWEEDAGVNGFTISACIAALVAGAPWLPLGASEFALQLADDWNSQIEAWTAVYDTALARAHGVEGYYVRMAPAGALIDHRALLDNLRISNRALAAGVPAEEQVGVDFLQLVRLGLRSADDPLIVDTLKVCDALLRVETPAGASWHRYTGDGYGEHDDGTAFDGVGVGRAWPLLTGERGHYEVAAGGDAAPHIDAMRNMSAGAGMLPEQVWDTAAIPEHGLFPGQPTGSSMPLCWAHAEFIKLIASRRAGRPCDRPEAVWQRYAGKRPQSTRAFSLPQAGRGSFSQGQEFSVCLEARSTVVWSADDWTHVQETATEDTGLGLHCARLPTTGLAVGARVQFATRNLATGAWSPRDQVAVVTA
jgi:glucoamylase